MSDFAVEVLRGATLQLAAVTELPRVELSLSEVRLRIEVRPESLLPEAVVRIVEDRKVDLIEVLPSIAGGAVTPVAYERRVDIQSDDLAYRGEAALGTANEAAAAWRIRRIEINPAGEPVVKWAKGLRTFTHTWAARAELEYS